MKLTIALLASTLGVLAVAAATAPAQDEPAVRDCGTLASDGVRYPVQLDGDVPCDDARAALRGFFDDGLSADGWACFRGHRGDTYAVRCATEPEGDAIADAVNPPRVETPARGRRGKRVTAVGSGLERGRYTLTLVADDPPAQGARCLARIGRARRTDGGWVTLRGRLPRRLRCYQGLNSFLGTVAASPGRYHLVVGAKVAPAGWDADLSFVRSAFRLR